MIDAKDQQLECTKCGRTFLFSAAEAQSFIDKGLTNVPKKCPDCRAKERAKKEQKVRVPVECASCGQTFEVPFTPAVDATGKPLRLLYCIEHFEQKTAEPVAG